MKEDAIKDLRDSVIATANSSMTTCGSCVVRIRSSGERRTIGSASIRRSARIACWRLVFFLEELLPPA